MTLRAPRHDPTSGTGDLCLFGWRVRSDVPLPELTPWTGDGRPAELTIRLGTVPPPPDAPSGPGRRLQVEADGSCRYEHPMGTAILVREGREMVVEPRGGGRAEHLPAILLGPALGMLCHQRGLAPLHASCVEVDGEAIAFTGPRGAGKSTLAAAFLHAGHRVLADDVTVVDLSGSSHGGAPVALPALPRLKLSAEALDLFGIDHRGLERSLLRQDKFHLPLAGAFGTTALRLRAICHMDSADGQGGPGLDRLLGSAAVAATSRALYLPRIAARIVGRRSLFDRVGCLVAAVGGIYRVRTGRGRAQADEAVARIVAGAGRGAPGCADSPATVRNR